MGGPRRRPAFERVAARIIEGPTVRPELGPCWDCLYHCDADGYPTIWVNERHVSVKISRVVLAEALGRPLRPTLCALHHCDRSACVNPDHLYEGSLSQNSRDRDERKGNPCPTGERHYQAKLTSAQVAQIRAERLRGTSLTHLGCSFGVAPATISCIVNGRTWKHVA